MRNKCAWFAGILCGIGGYIGTAHAESKSFPEFNTYETVLSNGLKVIVKEDRRAPVMVSQVWYKVGSSYEHGGSTGLSHVLEHMMFKGTNKHGPNEFSRIISQNGGKENAFTGKDYTSYFQQMEKTRLAVSFELEADRMRNLLLKGEEFEKEIKVVMEERRMRTDDDPQSLTYEYFNSVAYINSPYHHPVIGWMNDLENMKVDDLREWYKKWYAPNNATLVVAGDLKHEEVFELAEKYFGGLKTSEITPPKPQIEIAQLGERRNVIKAPAKIPYLFMGYKVPTIANAKQEWEPYALAMAAALLDGGNSARFAKNLIRGEQVAAGVGAGYDIFTPRQEVFVFSGTPAQGRTISDLEKSIKKQIEKLRSEKVTQKELDRVKAQAIASKVYEKDSLFYQAMAIGLLETTGQDWKLGEHYAEKIKSVTAEQVQEVAKKYFVDGGLTVAVLDPLPIDGQNVKGAKHAQ